METMIICILTRKIRYNSQPLKEPNKAGFSELYGSNNPKLKILNKEIDQINNQFL